jgi:hypothetical protein
VALTENRVDKWQVLKDMLRRDRRTGRTIIYTKDGGLVDAEPWDRQPKYNLNDVVMEVLSSNRM